MNAIGRKRIIQEYYSRRFKDYDRQKIRTWRNLHGFGSEVTAGLLDTLTSLEGRSLLEVGVGTGRIALPVLESVRPWFLGLDLSREMLGLAHAKLSSFKRDCALVLGDAEYLPFAGNFFDAIICMSTMHYFRSQEEILRKLSTILKEKGVLIYGDLTIHESDDQRFLEALEKTVSKAHARYYRPSEIKRMLETCGFDISRTRTFAYRKPYSSLMEDKGRYFNVAPETLQRCILGASVDAREKYAITSTELTLFYTVVTALKGT
jgi:ubiquinone/menaquinone biosynthesis C-methylase UbiE